jgi:hypothetical protein
MSFFSSTPAKILYAIALGAVIYYATMQRIAKTNTSVLTPAPVSR